VLCSNEIIYKTKKIQSKKRERIGSEISKGK